MLFIYILIIVFVLTVLLVIGMLRVYKNPKNPHKSTPAEHDIPFEEVRFPARNGSRLYGWWIPAGKNEQKNAPVLILVHGWGRNVERMMAYIKVFYHNGFNVLAFDARNHGSSEADGHSSMVKFAEDIQASIDLIEKRSKDGKPQIGVLGLSIGGAGSIYAAALDPRIRSVVTVGAFAHPADMMRQEFRRRHVPYFPFVWLLFKYMQHRIGVTLEQIAPVNNISKTQAHVFLIHGEKDDVVPLFNAQKLNNAGDPGRVRLWAIPGKGHSDCHREPGFWDKVLAFFKETH